jgi:hypothetical protein
VRGRTRAVVAPARAFSAPVRRYFNEHFNIVKREVQLTRESLLGAGLDHRANLEALTTAADKLRDSAAFLGMRLGRLEEAQTELAGSLRDGERPTPAAASGDLRHAAAHGAFVADALRDLPSGSAVVVHGANHVYAILAVLGHEPSNGPALAAAAIVAGDVGEAAAVAVERVVGGGVVVALGRAGASAGHHPRLEVVRELAIDDTVCVASRLQ